MGQTESRSRSNSNKNTHSRKTVNCRSPQSQVVNYSGSTTGNIITENITKMSEAVSQSVIETTPKPSDDFRREESSQKHNIVLPVDGDPIAILSTTTEGEATCQDNKSVCSETFEKNPKPDLDLVSQYNLKPIKCEEIKVAFESHSSKSGLSTISKVEENPSYVPQNDTPKNEDPKFVGVYSNPIHPDKVTKIQINPDSKSEFSFDLKFNEKEQLQIIKKSNSPTVNPEILDENLSYDSNIDSSTQIKELTQSDHVKENSEMDVSHLNKHVVMSHNIPFGENLLKVELLTGNNPKENTNNTVELMLDGNDLLVPSRDSELHLTSTKPPLDLKVGTKNKKSEVKEIEMTLKQNEKIINNLFGNKVGSRCSYKKNKYWSRKRTHPPLKNVSISSKPIEKLPVTFNIMGVQNRNTCSLKECILKMKNASPYNKCFMAVSEEDILNNLCHIEQFTSLLKTCPLNSNMISVCETIKRNLSLLTCQVIQNIGNPLMASSSNEPALQCQETTISHCNSELSNINGNVNSTSLGLQPSVQQHAEENVEGDKSGNNDSLLNNVVLTSSDEIVFPPNRNITSSVSLESGQNYKDLLEIIFKSLKDGFDIYESFFICIICDFSENNKDKAESHVHENHLGIENATWHICQFCQISLFCTEKRFEEHCTEPLHIDIKKLREDISIEGHPDGSRFQADIVATEDPNCLQADTMLTDVKKLSFGISNSDVSNKSVHNLSPHERLISVARCKGKGNCKMVEAVGLFCQVCNVDIVYGAGVPNHLNSEKHSTQMRSFSIESVHKYSKYHCSSCQIDLFGDNSIMRIHNNLESHKLSIKDKFEEKCLQEQYETVSHSEKTFESIDEAGSHFELMKKVLKRIFENEPQHTFYGFYCNLCQKYSLNESEWNAHLGSASHYTRVNSSDCVGRRIMYDCSVCNILLICDEQFFNLHLQSLAHKAISKYPSRAQETEVSESEDESSEEDSDVSENSNTVENDKSTSAAGKDKIVNSHIKHGNNPSKIPKNRTVEEGIILKGLPKEFTIKEFKNLCSRFGDLKSFSIDKANNCAWVTFKNKADAKAALDRGTMNYMRSQVAITPMVINKQSRNKRKKPNYKLNMDVIKIMSSYKDLFTLVDGILTLMAQSSHENQKKAKIIKSDLLSAVPGSSVLFFGSQITGLATDQSDYDIYIDIDGKSFYRDLSLKQQGDVVRHLGYKFGQPGSKFIVKESIPVARVPIIKVVHKQTNTLCDISCRSGLSVENSHLIRLFLDSDPRVRWLTAMVKWWMHNNGLVNRSSFTSYATIWLVFFYLMIIKPNPVLCSVADLQEGCHPRTIAGWDCRFTRRINEVFQQRNNQNLLELLSGFFYTYSIMDCKGFVLCPLIGGSVARHLFHSLRLPPQFKPYIMRVRSHESAEKLRLSTPLCLQDPFDLSHNITKGVSPQDFTKFQQLCGESHKLCQNLLLRQK